MGLKASCHWRLFISFPSNFSLKKRGQQLKRMYSAIPEAVKESSLRSSSPDSSSMSSSLRFAASLPLLKCSCLNLSRAYCMYRMLTLKNVLTEKVTNRKNTLKTGIIFIIHIYCGLVKV
jgi:hypothetical protein